MSEFTTLPARQLGDPVVGHPRQWARDLAVLGATLPASAALSLTLFHLTPVELLWPRLPSLLAICVAGAVLGGILGAGIGYTLERVRGQVPLTLLITAGILGGATWGLATVFVGTLGGALPLAMLLFTLWWGTLVGVAGVPYLISRVLRGPTATILAATVLVAGPLAIFVDQLIWLAISIGL